MSAIRLVRFPLALVGLLAVGGLVAATARAAEPHPADSSSRLRPKARAEAPLKPVGRSNGSGWTRSPDGKLVFQNGDTTVTVSGEVTAGFAATARH